MHATPIEIKFFGNSNSDFIGFNFYTMNKWIYGIRIFFKTNIDKSDVYCSRVLLNQLVNGDPFTLNGEEIIICKFIHWGQKVHVEEIDGFQQIFDVAINNSIVGFDYNESQSFFKNSLQCIKVIFVPNLLCSSFNLWSSKFQTQNHGFDVILEAIGNKIN
jgi:hypothetical protein